MEHKFEAQFGPLLSFYPVEMPQKRENAVRDCIKISAYNK